MVIQKQDGTISGEPSKKIGYQMSSKLSFVFILIVCGIPLWWKLTKVERNYIPYRQIDALNGSNIQFLVNIYVCAISSKSSYDIIRDLPALFSSLDVYSVHIQHCPIDISATKSSNINELESNDLIHPTKPGSLHLWEVLNSTHSEDVFIGRRRTVYFKQGCDLVNIYHIIKEILFLEDEILEVIETVTSSSHISSSISQLRRVRASTEYDVVFTTVHSEPTKFNLIWNQKLVLEHFFEPFLQQLSSFAKFNVKSHWLFGTNLDVIPTLFNNGTDKYYAFTYDHISRIITPLENRLGSGVLKNPCIHFVLYCSKCSHTPSYFADKRGIRSVAALSDRWGGIQLLNPTLKNCVNSTRLIANSKLITDIFVKQFRLLLGLKNYTETTNSILLPAAEDSVIRDWELDNLYRLRIAEFFIKSKLTLLSLSQLLEEINNIVITPEVSQAVINAVQATEFILDFSKNGDLNLALNYSKEAYVASEYAFTHPSMLALLYFPDDQKYAIYIPLFLPVMIPVLLSFNSIRLWIIKCWRVGALVDEDIIYNENENADVDTPDEEHKKTD